LIPRGGGGIFSNAMDPYGRTIDYLRISVTDRCNERCLYCMPEGYKGWSQKETHLRPSEIVRLVEAAVGTGFCKFRLSGGEPLLRPDLVEIAQGIRSVPGVEWLGLSTNGILLATQAVALRGAGISSVNISLDALQPATYHRITGGSLERVMQGIRAAQAAGFESIKLNCVLMRGINEQEIWPLVDFAAEHGLPIRFIELMPLTRTDVLNEENFFPVGEAMRLLGQKDRLIPLSRRLGNGPARYHRLENSGAVVGFIGAITTPDFCESCNKIRLTSDGKLRPCLGRHGEIDLLPTLRGEGDLADLIRATLAAKPKDHEFTDSFEPGRPMTAIGG
jgi:cyclic pyranopterin phosphate synthase